MKSSAGSSIYVYSTVAIEKASTAQLTGPGALFGDARQLLKRQLASRAGTLAEIPWTHPT